MAIDRNNIRLGSRYQRAIEKNGDKFGATGPKVLDLNGCKLKFYKFGEVKSYYDLNVLPFVVGGRKHPAVKSGELKPGDWDFMVDYWVHRDVGPEKGQYICIKKTYGLPCPMCDEAERLKAEQGSDAAKGMWASHRALMAVQPLDSHGHGDAEPMLLDMAYNNFALDLIDESESCMRGDGVVDFANLGPEGREVSFRVAEDTMGNGRKYKLAKNFAFNKRREEIPDSVVEKVPSLDELLNVPTAGDITRAMFGGPSEEPDDSRRRDRDDDRRDYERDQRNDREDDRRARDDQDERPSRTLRGRDGQDFEDPFPDQPTNLDRSDRRRDEQEERPRRQEPDERPREPARDEQAERPRRQDVAEDRPRRPEPEQDKCPNGYRWGADCDKKGLCYDCPDAVYHKCKAARNQ